MVLVRIVVLASVSVTIVGCVSSSAPPTSKAPPPSTTVATPNEVDEHRLTLEIGVTCAATPASCNKNSGVASAPPTTPFNSLTGPNVIVRGNGVAPVATTEQQCAACNGVWGPHGIAQIVGCICGTPDANRPCTSPLDCAAECVVLDPDAFDHGGGCPALNAKFEGNCSGSYWNFGCTVRVIEQPTPQGPMRQLTRTCLD
jgi:hypothetical protein